MQLTSSIERVTPDVAAGPDLRVLILPEPQATPLWTRHSVGAIEADRDRRRARRVHTTVRYTTAPPAPAIPIRPEVVAQ
jgi:hypothetical protein